MKERKDRVDDGLHATRAAVEEGIVPGGGVALARASLILAKLKPDNDDQRVGIDIVRKAVQRPLRQIAENAGEDGAVISGKVLRKTNTTGASTRRPVNSRTWSRPASSTRPRSCGPRCNTPPRSRALMMTTEAMVADRPEKASTQADHRMAAWVTWATERRLCRGVAGVVYAEVTPPPARNHLNSLDNAEAEGRFTAYSLGCTARSSKARSCIGVGCG